MVVLRRVSGMAKVDGVLRPFRGRQDEFDEFWKKFHVVARIQKWEGRGSKNEPSPIVSIRRRVLGVERDE